MFPMFGVRCSGTRVVVLAVALCLLFLAAPLAVQAQDETSLYLPAVLGPPPPVPHGTVTYAGEPIGGIQIELWRYSQVDPVLVATTVTASDGSYGFPDAPQLEGTEVYAARFDNYVNNYPRDERFAGRCETLIRGKGDPTGLLGHFDIDDITQQAPKHDATAKLPVTFTWTHDAPASGVYQVQISRAYSGGNQFDSPDIPAGTKSYTLDALPAGFGTGTFYAWLVTNFTDTAFCSSKYVYYVKIEN